MSRGTVVRGAVASILVVLLGVSVLSCSRGGRPDRAHLPIREPRPVVGWAYLPELERPLPTRGRDHGSAWEKAWRALESDRLDEAYFLTEPLARERAVRACARSFLGLVELRAGRLELAREHFDVGLGRAADSCSVSIARSGIFLLLLESGDKDAAFAELEALGREQPQHALVLAFRDPLRAELANEWLRRGRDEQASPEASAEALAHALRFAPEAADLHLELARAERAAGASELALASVKRAVALRRGDQPALELYAELLEEEGRLDEALDAWEAAARTAPLDPAIAEHRRRLGRRLRLQVPRGRLDRIRESPSLTRAELSAVLCETLLDAMTSAPRSGVIVTDVQESWARDAILESLALGLQDPYPGHVFEPTSRASRAELTSALRRAARWIDHDCPAQEGGPCGRPGGTARAMELVDRVLAGSPAVTGACAFDAGRALSRIAAACHRR